MPLRTYDCRVKRFIVKFLFLLVIIIQYSSFGDDFVSGSARFEWLGNHIPTAVSPDGRVLVGTSSSLAGIFRWDEKSGYTQLAHLNTDYNKSSVLDVSNDGLTIVGYSKYDTVKAESGVFSKLRAVRWSSSGAITALPTEGSDQSLAYAVDASGNTIVGTTASIYLVKPYGGYSYYTANGSPTRWASVSGELLPVLDSRVQGIPYGISPDGSVIVGYTKKVGSGGPQAVKWDATGMVDLGFSPVNYSKAVCASAYGDIVIAIDQYNGRSRSYKIVGTTKTTIGDSTIPNAITADGRRILGSTAKHGTPFAIIWDAGSNTPQNLKTYLEQTHNLKLGSAQLYYGAAMSDDGDVIVGSGYDSMNVYQGFRVVFDTARIKVWNPSKGKLWLAGTVDTIRWSTYLSVDYVNIYLSTDSGVTKSPIVENYPASLEQYGWRMPDTLFSAKCKIIITIPGDSARGESKLFRVKNRHLTRFDNAGQYELFKQGVHDYSFNNDDMWVWPSGWYTQFNYKGIDPITSQPYSTDRDKPFATAQSKDFPDWPLFVHVFGTSECYHKTTAPAIYNERACEWWRARKGKWNGSCWGFTTSTLLAFEDKTKFRSAFPEMKNYTNLNELACDDSVRTLINMMWVHQFSESRQNFIEPLWDAITPTQTVRDINAMILSEKRSNDRFLGLTSNGPAEGSHVIVPIGLSGEESVPGIVFIHVYDNNFPNDTNAKIWVDTLANDGNGSWVYPNLPGWGGDKWLFLMDPINTYYTKPTIPRDAGPTFGTAYSNNSSSFVITDSLGNKIGFRNDSLIKNIPNATPIRVFSGEIEPPVGYKLPIGNYSITTSQSTDSIASFSFFADSSIIRYTRQNALLNQNDILFLGKERELSTVNNESIDKTVDLKVVLENPSEDRVFLIEEINVAPDDSLVIASKDKSALTLSHRAASTQFRLVIRQLIQGGENGFTHNEVTFSANSCYKIMPNWSSFSSDNSIRIMVDNGNDGTFDDSLFLSNEYVSLESKDAVSPTEYGLDDVYPNPFNPMTNIRYRIPVKSFAEIKIFNTLGQPIATLVSEVQTSGYKNVVWNAANIASGVYFCRFEASDVNHSTNKFTQMRRILLLK
jgi:uncharacterized membrane protein